MRKIIFIVALTTILLPALVPAATSPDILNKTKILNKTYRMQIPFIENKGQVGSDEISFYAKTFGGTVFVGKDGTLTYSLSLGEKGGVVIKEVLTENKVEVKGLDPAPTKINYFKGNDQSKWKTNIPSYNSVSLGEVYEGVELTLKAYGNNVEKLFTVLPAADPEAIKVTLQGATELKVNEKSELEVITNHGPITFTKPLAYQEINGKRVEVEVCYNLINDKCQNQNDKESSHISDPRSHISHTPSLHALPTTPNQQSAAYSFRVEDYDKRYPLIIDPLLASTFLGGGGDDEGQSLVLDSSGNLYVIGYAGSGFPTTPDVYDESYNPGGTFGWDMFVSKLDSSLSTLLASTYIGGDGDDSGISLALDGSGNVYVAGVTGSSDFPSTLGAYDETHNGLNDVFVSKLDSTLSTLLASTYIGGIDDDSGTFLALDGSGNVCVTGYAGSGFPTTPDVYDESYNPGGTFGWDVFVSKLDSSLSTLLASTYIGGDGDDSGISLALDGSGNVYVTGYAGSGFPIIPGAYDEIYNGGTYDAFVSKLDSTLSTLLASTFLGGGFRDFGESLSLDGSGNVYISGFTFSAEYPTTPGAYDTSRNGAYDALVSKLDSTLSTLLASTFMGKAFYDRHPQLALDGSGNIYVAGRSEYSDFPATPGAYDETHNGVNDVIISKLDSTLSTLLASTFMGASGNDYGNALALDSIGNVYVTGATFSTDYPATSGAYDETHNGSSDVFVSKLDRSLLSDLGITFRTAVNFGGEFTGSSQFLEDNPPLEDPFAYIQCPSYTLTIDFWLTDWSGANVKAVDYYFTWDTSLFDVESVTSNTPWDTHSETLDGDVYHLYLESSSGIAPNPDGDIKLHSVTFSIIGAPGSGRVKAELLPDGYVEDVNAIHYTSIGKTEITVQTICDFNTPTECTEDNPCDILAADAICPLDATVTENNYSLTPQGVSVCEGDRISVFHTKKGSYTQEVVEPIVEMCDSGCFDQCMDNCTYVELQGCYLRCITGCVNGLCANWSNPEVCYEFQMRVDCNVSCYNQCADSYNPSTQTSSYTKLCGFSINEPITLRDTSTNCSGTVRGTYTLTGAGTAGINITTPFEAGTGSHSYDICAGSTFIQRVTVGDCGADCSITLPTNALVTNQGINTSLMVTLANQDAGGDYDIELKRYEDDDHLIELSVPTSLEYPLEKNVGANGSTSFSIDAIDPQAEGGLNHWANIIVRTTSGPYSCESAFDYRVVCPQVDTDFDGTIDCIDNCPEDSNPDQDDTYPPQGNNIGDACDCEADFNCDGNVDATDVTSFLGDFGRSIYFNPCTNENPCNGDFKCNVNVDANDVTKFLEDFGRSRFFNPCPPCVMGEWCAYE